MPDSEHQPNCPRSAFWDGGDGEVPCFCDPIEVEEGDLSGCPYFQGTGYCESGCTTEPSCMTDRPAEGWPSERK